MMNQQNVRATISNRLSVSQEDRIVDALLPTYVKIDDRTLADRLAYIKEYAQKIVYYNKQNIADGNWEYFFLRDIAILLAVISKVELKDIEEERLRLLKAYRLASNEQERIKYFRAFFDFIISVSNQISDWKQQITSTIDFMTEEHNGFYFDLKYLIDNYFLEAYQELSDHIKKLEETEYLKESLGNRLDNVLNDVLDNKSDDNKSLSLTFPNFTKKERSEIKKWEQNLLKNLNIIYKKFHKGIQKIMQVTPLYFKETLTKKYNHSPNNALYIAFLHLIEQLQHQINGLSTKHLEYYYKKILHQENKVGTPDKVFVYFKLTKAFDNFFLKKGTPLKANKNEQEIIPIYKTDFDLQITKTSIEALKTVFVSKNRYINLDSDYQLIANIYAAPIANSKDGHGLPFNTEQPKWATFGEEQLDKTSPNQTMQPATVGVVIATPILHLREGKRSIDLRFVIKKETDHNYNTFIEDIAAHRKLSYLDTFSLIFNNSFKIFLTTETGWKSIDTYHVFPTIDEDLSILNLGITLDMGFPAIVGNNPEVITENFSTTQPMIKILLTGEKSAYAYSFFQYLELDAIEIDVQVEKMKQLNLFTEVGEIDDSLPFQFFGPTPRLGSFLLVGNDEVFKKQLTDLSFDIVWNNLPKTRNGFKDYYKGYPADFENSDFEVSLTVLKDFEFYPPAEDQVIRFPLFASTQGENRTTPLVPFSSIHEVPVETLRLTPNYDLSTDLVYDNFTKTGFFKLELCNPPLGFGEDVFVDTYAAAVQNNAFLESKYGKGGGKKKDEMVVVPKLPFVPVARSLTMGYRASTKIDYTNVNLKDKATEVYHIHPFGRDRVFYHGKVYNDAPLPKFEYDGYLYIGLKDLIPPQTLTLYFELADSVKANTAQKAPKVTWSYLSKNSWHDFQESQLLYDGTVGFSTSGIIRIDIPHHISLDNTIMSNKLHWLRAAVDGDVELLSTTYNIYTQAVSATWQPDEKDSHHFDAPLPAGSVERTQEDIAAIIKVNQPYPSFGGIAPESAAQFYTRVSERLRHKDRAVTYWDFERLVLNKFPSVQQVKCFANFTHPKYVKPGEVIVLIIPKTNEYNMMPRANIKMLNEVKEYLDNMSSPFVRVIVRNPLYEQVSVICDIRFDRGKNNGLYIGQLNKELNTFLSPHTGGKERHTKLSGKISKETILNFIEQRPYVDFITKNSVIQLITEEDGDKLLVDTANKALPTTTIFANYPWSVLVPVKHHRLKLLPADDYTYKSPETTAIGKMSVGVDFVIQNREAEKKIAEHEQKTRVIANPQKSLNKKDTLEEGKEKNTLKEQKEKAASGERKVYSLEWNINLNK